MSTLHSAVFAPLLILLLPAAAWAEDATSIAAQDASLTTAAALQLDDPVTALGLLRMVAHPERTTGWRQAALLASAAGYPTALGRAPFTPSRGWYRAAFAEEGRAVVVCAKQQACVEWDAGAGTPPVELELPTDSVPLEGAWTHPDGGAYIAVKGDPESGLFINPVVGVGYFQATFDEFEWVDTRIQYQLGIAWQAFLPAAPAASAVSADGRIVAVLVGDEVWVYEPAEGREPRALAVGILQGAADSPAIALSAEGRFLAVMSDRREVRLWDLEARRARPKTLRTPKSCGDEEINESAWLQDVGFGAEGQLEALLRAGEQGPGYLPSWEPTKGRSSGCVVRSEAEFREMFPAPTPAHAGSSRAWQERPQAFDYAEPDGSHFARLEEDGTVAVWAAGEDYAQLQLPSTAASVLAVRDDGQRLVLLTTSHHLQVWELSHDAIREALEERASFCVDAARLEVLLAPGPAARDDAYPKGCGPVAP
jgi:hypothetical protein